MDSIVYTNKARCRDCYRCVRMCPVKAIRMRDGQAFVVAEACVSCGTCIRECPQGAKVFRRDVERVEEMLAQPGMTAASVAPSFAALFTEAERRRFPSVLRRLGFGFVSETAVGATPVAHATADWAATHPGETHIATSCPAVVCYVERYRPELVPCLTPVASPMVAHARHLKQKLGPDTRVVFIGPCVAKKMEAARAATGGAVDAVLTFLELQEWLERKGMSLTSCEESDFDEQPAGESRLFPLAGGCLRTAGLTTDLLSTRVVAVSGIEELGEALDASLPGQIVEPLFCRLGCINGPAIHDTRKLFERRDKVLSYASERPGVPGKGSASVPLEMAFHADGLVLATVDEAAILAELELTGKANPDNQLNCGACGYPSCRDKALAVLRGMAEREMCIPFMRLRAEQRTDRIMETSPNGIVILDEHLSIINMNPAFRKTFMCSESVCGRRISYLMDPHLFETIASGEKDLVEAVVRHDRYGLECHQVLYALRDEKQYVGIFVNITHSRASQEKLSHLRAQTVQQAQQLLEHQVAMAQQIARLLGDSAARGEMLVEHLRELGRDEGGGTDRQERRPWLDDIYTSKA